MRPLELLVVYLFLGLGVSIAWKNAGRDGWALALPLWPLFVPGLLVPREIPVVSAPGRVQAAVDRLARAITGWEGLPDRAMCEASLCAAARGLAALSERHDQLDTALQGPLHDPDQLRRELEQAPAASRPILEARLRNVERLLALRDQAREELERGLAGLDELATRVHLARFTGAPAEELGLRIARLAAAVDGAAEVSRLGRG